ncbi:MAG: alanine racemase [Candidatus Buchananbacteria bacterium RIFCSPLOWO2_01_FULL_39_33]|uniref:Alanine racemase n=1 Tax=Candidatus Buchananbacteria bacterium RIFCSPLOWO2_01_FULL_39_33 TaxID=1797543 RepID=A0A1G1YLR5_9BACT|nr:MAG: alanine racemase [Candidatus Buchananbacteria bacterium RIFCSPHIGHO2_01_FULL_40_35]OGY53295.1 MAG: alanine racemase [Candidatus Buchananbacteria bacterium RIFCSPLOWO2_01_FULL_39_33]
MNDLVWLEIKKENLISNIKTLKNLAGSKVLISPCVKANAYGHGLIETAKIFISAGADWLSVNSIEEAKKIRDVGINRPILVIGYVAESELEKILDWDLKIFISNFDYAEKLSMTGKIKNKIAKVHLKIDTGMHRYGVLMAEAEELAKKIKKLPHITIEGLATHFATSDEPLNLSYFNRQLENFKEIVPKIKNLVGNDLIIHCDKSASLLLCRHGLADLVRPGIAAYGYYPSQDVAKLAQEKNIILRPALSFKTKIGQIKKIPENSCVGYGCTCYTKRPTVLATIPVGYYDGYDRKLSNQGYVLVNGQKAPILGRVCMNITIIDITDCGQVIEGDEVVLIGEQGQENITVEQIANWAKTINYEVITRLRESLPRYYI